jgi:hypothetical protein
LNCWLNGEIGYQRADLPANRLLNGIAELHFVSLFTVTTPDGSGNPDGYLVLEANFDGPVDGFVNRLTQEFEQPLKVIFGHCVRPANDDLAAFIKRHSRKVDCFYVSCPGMSRGQIEQERALMELLQQERDGLARAGGAAYHDFDEVVTHLRNSVNPDTLESRAPAVPFWVEYGQSIFAAASVLILMILISLVVLALGRWPALENIGQQPLLLGALGLAIAAAAHFVKPAGTSALERAILLLGILASAAGAVAISRILPEEAFMASRLALAGIAVVVGAIALALYQLELLERVDCIDPGFVDVEFMRTVCQDENSPGCMQNHFVNLSLVKEGVLRLWALRLVLWFIHIAGVVYFNQGRLGGIPSIHFARWMIFKDEGFKNPLLLFMTNYDASWDSYLGDFVDEASEGVSGIWSNTGGFPRTWFLMVGGGSRFEKQFKAYARKGQQRSLAWFTAYPNVSVGQKLGNAAVRRAFDERPSGMATLRRAFREKPAVASIAEQDNLLRRL